MVLCTNPIEVGIDLFPGSVLSQLILCPDDSHLTDCASWVSFSNSTGDRCILVEHTGNTWLTVLTCRQTLPHENPVNLQHTKHHPDWKSLILPEISNVSIRYIIKGEFITNLFSLEPYLHIPIWVHTLMGFICRGKTSHFRLHAISESRQTGPPWAQKGRCQ